MTRVMRHDGYKRAGVKSNLSKIKGLRHIKLLGDKNKYLCHLDRSEYSHMNQRLACDNNYFGIFCHRFLVPLTGGVSCIEGGGVRARRG